MFTNEKMAGVQLKKERHGNGEHWFEDRNSNHPVAAARGARGEQQQRRDEVAPRWEVAKKVGQEKMSQHPLRVGCSHTCHSCKGLGGLTDAKWSQMETRGDGVCGLYGP
jgi:hypothetical protein